MRNRYYFPILWLCAFIFLAGCSPQLPQTTQKFFPEFNDLAAVTPALKKEKGYTNYTELISFLTALEKEFPQKIKHSFIGKSKNGMAIPMVVLSNGNNANKARIWMQGGLHGDEPAGTESLLLLIHQLLHDSSLFYLLEKTDIAIVPMFNIDGYLKQERRNAEGLDLNRDQTKLMAVESIPLKEAYSAFKPDIALDLHEYRPFRKDFVTLSTSGVSSAYDVMFLYSGNLNVPERLRQLTLNRFVNPTYEKLNRWHYTHHEYVTSEVEKGDIHFNQGSNNARSSATNFALQQSVSTLLEVRGVGIGRTSFKRRIHIGQIVALSYAQIAATLSAEELQSIRIPNNPKTITVQSRKARYQDSLLFIDLDKNELISIPVTIKDALKSESKLTRTRPLFYAIEPSQAFLIPKISAFGLSIDTLKAPTSFKAETYTVTHYKKSANAYESVFLQEVKTEITEKPLTLKSGTFIIRMDQASSNILIELLEPEAPNSFISFGILPTKAGEPLPIYRLIP